MNAAFTVYGICTALAALVSILLFGYLSRGTVYRDETPALALCLIPAGLFTARLLYLLFRIPFFGASVLARFFYLREGGFLLYGAMLGICLAAIRYTAAKKRTAFSLLDLLTIPGLAAIAVCRFAEGSAGEGLGNWVENEALAVFPLAFPNAYGEMQWAVFILEGAAALLMGVCLYFRKTEVPGQRFLCGLTLYAGCQTVFESLRMDSVLKIGFVRVSQVISVVVLLGILLYCRLSSGNRAKAAVDSGILLLCVGIVGGLEWALEKTQISNAVIYAVMILASAGMIFLTLRAVAGLKQRHR